MDVERPQRKGAPWPLILHLASAASLLEQGARVAPLADSPAVPWRGPLLASEATLASAVAAAETQAMSVAIRREAALRLAKMSRGLKRYQNSPERRTLEDPPEIWRLGAARLLDFGYSSGQPVFIAPSLVNRFHILDLDEDASLLRFLRSRNLRPLLLDWGDPKTAERRFTITDYVEQRLLPAFDAASQAVGAPVSVIGYCLGGAMATALAQLRHDQVRRLALIGAPWDFSAMKPMQAALSSLGVSSDRTSLGAIVQSLGSTYGAIPVPALQAIFAQLDPGLALAKFRRFADLPEGAEARRFVLLEDWLNEGPPLSAPAAGEALLDWHLDNAPIRGGWRVAGRTIDPGQISAPTMIAAATRDRIAPQAAAAALAEKIATARLIRPDAGHVGMITGRDAMAQLWRPLADFLLD